MIGGVFLLIGSLLAGLLTSLLAGPFTGLLADLLTGSLDALALLLLAELILEDLGEQEISAHSGGGYADDDSKDDPKGVATLLLFLMEAAHSKFPPSFLGGIAYPYTCS